MISNRETLTLSRSHEIALSCIESAINAAAPASAAEDVIIRKGETLYIKDKAYDLTKYDSVYIVGGGKATKGVVEVLETVLKDRITDGLVISPAHIETDFVDHRVGTHPLPSKQNVNATEELIRIVDQADKHSLVLVLVSGGGSALLTAPVSPITVSALQMTTRALLDQGASIEDINTVRKQLSKIKGGQLAERIAPADTAGLIISDVVGNDLGTIASGPTVPESQTAGDALQVLENYNISPSSTVIEYLKKNRSEPGASPLRRGENPPVQNHLLVNNRRALTKAAKVASEAGYTPMILSSTLEGEARWVGITIATVVREASDYGGPVDPPAVLIAGGECTVTVQGDGVGGPNQELALGAVDALPEAAVLAAVDSDGHDGSTNFAGAIVDSQLGIEAREATTALANNDATALLKQYDRCIRTGSTGTNVNDIVVAVIPNPEEN